VGHQLIVLIVLADRVNRVDARGDLPRAESVVRVQEPVVPASRLVSRKLFYLFTCEYCFSHWVTIVFLAITRFRLFFDDWRGFLIAGFSLVWLANVYMRFFGRLRLEIREDRIEIAAAESRDRGSRP
jgi:hypothetical protein